MESFSESHVNTTKRSGKCNARCASEKCGGEGEDTDVSMCGQTNTASETVLRQMVTKLWLEKLK